MDKSKEEQMFLNLAQSKAHFQHQQRGEPDLTIQQKCEIAKELFDKNLVTFLTRFWKFLSVQDLDCFEAHESQYEVKFYMGEIVKNCNATFCETRTKNRRFEAMKKLMENGEYFGEEAMKSRDPLLYEQMIGRHLTDDEINDRVKQMDNGIADVFLSHIQCLHNNQLYDAQKEKEESQFEEEDSDDDEEDMDETEQPAAESTGQQEEQITPLEKQMLRNEFLRVMQHRFLKGEDYGYFDYQEVDDNTDYDPVEICDHDEEEKYFDDEDSQSAPGSMTKHHGNNQSSSSSLNVDYEDYQVEQDVCPGLLEKTEEKTQTVLLSAPKADSQNDM